MSNHDGSAELLRMSALEQAQAIAARRVSSVELARIYLDRIAQFNDRLNAFVTVTRRRALLAARRADRETLRRPGTLPLFHGVPVGIKDLVPTAGVRSQLGSRSYKYFVPPISGTIVKRLSAGGFVSLGKLATSEFGVLPTTEPDIHPPTRNPWDTSRSSGGSSGGSGSAVAAGLLPIAHGSDGGGSVRIPSAFCHLYGFKPSLSLLGNLHGEVNKLGTSVMGPLARSVRDAAAMLDVMAGRPRGGNDTESCLAACQRDPRPMRVHMCLEQPMGDVDPEIAAAVRQTGQRLQELGHDVVEVPMIAADLDTFLPVYQYMVSRIPAISDRLLRPVTQWLRADRPAVSFEVAKEAQDVLCNRLAKLLGDADVLLTPTVGVEPPRLGAFDNADPARWFRAAAQLGGFTAGFNLTTGPAASLPMGLTDSGLPYGVQIGGRAGHDHEILAISRQLEIDSPWHDRWAPDYAP
ncbi:MAG: amidase [Polyangiaceae bacterium]